MTQAAPTEAILEPDLPIVDPHHHLWDRPRAMVAALADSKHDFSRVIEKSPRYLLDQLMADLNTGHNIRATVYMECGAFYRADGPAPLRCVGETEFVNGVAAMSASGLYGEARACAGIVGHADLTLGGAVGDGARRSDHGRQRPFSRHPPFRRQRSRPAGPRPAARPAGGPIPRSYVPRGLRLPGAAGPVVRRMDAGAAAARPYRPGQGLSRHPDHSRPCRHAAGPRRLRGPAR